LQYRITQISASYTTDSEGRCLNPAIIHYPRGGGYFGEHGHNFLPQKAGLILSLSKRGIDFTSGGTRFCDGKSWVSIEAFHDIGDICLFRYDFPHDVTEVDPHHHLSLERQEGKWSAVLPFN